MSDSKPSPAPKAKPRKCGLVMPISSIDGCTESHWEQVRGIIREALDGLELDIELVSEADEVGVIQGRIIHNLYENEIVVCDVSCKNPNVMFELGMRLAFDKPVVVIKDEITSYSFDTSPVEHLSYPRSLHYHQIQEFKKKLRLKVESTIEAPKKDGYVSFLKHFGRYVVAGLEQKTVGKEEFILSRLEEMSRDIRRMRAEQQESSAHLYRSPIRIPSVEEFVMENMKSRLLSPKEIMALKDPSSAAFQKLHSDYVDTVLSRVVNPKPRHEAQAAKDLSDVLAKILP